MSIKLSIVIPCYNEKNTISEIINRINLVNYPDGISTEIIVVDDYSSDGTREILQEISNKNPNLKLILQEKNQGKSAALKAGFLATTGDLVIVQDADLEYDPEDYVKMLVPFQKNLCDVVLGSRFLGGGYLNTLSTLQVIANKFMTQLSNLLSGKYLTDIHTCYIMMKGDWIRKITPTLKANRFGFNPEIIAKISRANLVICEVGISYFARTKDQGKKIKLGDGIKAIIEIIKYNIFK